MPTIRQIVFGLVVAVGTLVAGQVLADRGPSLEERSRIETMLRNEGFTAWGTIALDDDDDVWEIDDAHDSDGNRCDLRRHIGDHNARAVSRVTDARRLGGALVFVPPPQSAVSSKCPSLATS